MMHQVTKSDTIVIYRKYHLSKIFSGKISRAPGIPSFILQKKQYKFFKNQREIEEGRGINRVICMVLREHKLQHISC